MPIPNPMANAMRRTLWALALTPVAGLIASFAGVPANIVLAFGVVALIVILSLLIGFRFGGRVAQKGITELVEGGAWVHWTYDLVSWAAWIEATYEKTKDLRSLPARAQFAIFVLPLLIMAGVMAYQTYDARIHSWHWTGLDTITALALVMACSILPVILKIVPIFTRRRSMASLPEAYVGRDSIYQLGHYVTWAKLGFSLQKVQLARGTPSELIFLYTINYGRGQAEEHVLVPSGREDEALALVQRFKKDVFT